MLSVHLNQIWAMSQLRKQVQYSCLVGCVGDINAGKTTLVRALLGLPPEEKGHLTENATRHVTAIAMPMRTAKGLAELPASPMLVDTPGMFDTDSVLADTAVRYLGECWLSPIVLHDVQQVTDGQDALNYLAFIRHVCMSSCVACLAYLAPYAVSSVIVQAWNHHDIL